MLQLAYQMVLDPAIEFKLQTQGTLAPITVRDALEKWLEEYADKRRANAQKHKQQFEKWIFPYHGDTPLERNGARALDLLFY